MKTCFIIAPIGEKGSKIRKHSDQTLKHVITPALRECGYDAKRADQISQPGMITSQIIDRLLSEPLVIADLTGLNANVFYELAMRHAIRKPFVQLIGNDDQLPFDTASMRTVKYNLSDPDSVSDAVQELVNQIKAIEANEENIQTPFSVAVDLRQREIPEKQILADILAELASVRKSVETLLVTNQQIGGETPEESVPLPPPPLPRHRLPLLKKERSKSTEPTDDPPGI